VETRLGTSHKKCSADKDDDRIHQVFHLWFAFFKTC
jgi:hypothetical protein